MYEIYIARRYLITALHLQIYYTAVCQALFDRQGKDRKIMAGSVPSEQMFGLTYIVVITPTTRINHIAYPYYTLIPLLLSS